MHFTTMSRTVVFEAKLIVKLFTLDGFVAPMLDSEISYRLRSCDSVIPR